MYMLLEFVLGIAYDNLNSIKELIYDLFSNLKLYFWVNDFIATQPINNGRHPLICHAQL